MAPKNLFLNSYHKRELKDSIPKILQIQKSEDHTTKFLLEFNDASRVESVLIPFHEKYSACLSTQVGCAMNCSFCYTGTQGLKRNLNYAEIVGQYYILCMYVLENKLLEIYKHPSIVFMGQGEPLHNFDQLKLSIEYLLNKKNFYLGPRQITVSTSGLLPYILRFNELGGVNLAISLHSADNIIRNKLIPLNKKYPIEELLLALKKVKLKKRQFITFEYLLIKDLNTDKLQAHKLASLLQDIPAIVNLIPFNPFPGSSFKRPLSAEIEEFKSELVKLKVRTMIRITKGEDILAACGQLNTV